jgi:hypothetical protein
MYSLSVIPADLYPKFSQNGGYACYTEGMRDWVVGLKVAVIVGVFFCAGSAHAATLYMDPAETHGYRADTLTMNVRLDTDEGECVNTIDATVEYGSAVAAVDVSTGDSIVSLWVETPTIDQTARTIRFAGGIPNGYCGRVPGDPRLTNIIATLVFQIPGFVVGGGDTKQATVTFGPTTRVLLNDGEGTDAPLRTFGGVITLDDRAGAEIQDPWTKAVGADTVPPSPFSVELVQNDQVYGGNYYIVFSTTDKQSGMDHYEVMEEPIEELSLFRWGVPDVAWAQVKSPYVLKDQNLRSVVRVKAVDKAGNERIAVFAPEEAARVIDPLAAVLVLTVATAFVLLLALVAYVARRRFARAAARSSAPTHSDDVSP